MRLKKQILLSCVVISSILFVSGLITLIFLNRGSNDKIYAQESPVKIEGKIEGAEIKNEIPRDPPVNLLIIGLDEEEVRSDVILLLNFNPGDGRLNILSVARDTRIRVRGKIAKMNALMGIGGESLLIKGVEQLTGLQINYHVTLDFKGFRKMIDVLEGVEFEVPFNMDYDDPEQNLHIHLKKGTQILDGKKAEQFVRYRKGNRPEQGYVDGDIGRIKSQQKFVKALIEQKVKLKYLSKADDIFNILKKNMRTNIELGDVNRYVKSLRNIKYEGIGTYTVPGDSAYIEDVWYFICDKDKTRELIDKHFYK